MLSIRTPGIRWLTNPIATKNGDHMTAVLTPRIDAAARTSREESSSLAALMGASTAIAPTLRIAPSRCEPYNIHEDLALASR